MIEMKTRMPRPDKSLLSRFPAAYAPPTKIRSKKRPVAVAVQG